MPMLHEYPDTVTMVDSTIGTTAAEVTPGGAGQTQVTILNDHGSETIYVGWNSSVGSATDDHFIGGALATTESIVLTNYRGPVWIEASAASVAYVSEIRSAKRTA